jgi:hypothetical protein
MALTPLACASHDDGGAADSDAAAIVAENVRVVDNTDGAKVSADRVVVPLSGNAKILDSVAGDFVVGRRGAAGSSNPKGFLRRVRSVSKDATSITIMTDNAELASVVKQGSFEQKKNFSAGRTGGTTTTKSFGTGPLTYQFAGSLGSITKGSATLSAETDGHITFDPVIDIGGHLGFGGPPEFHAIAGGDLDASLQVHVKAEGPKSDAGPTLTLAQYRQPLAAGEFDFMLGIVPVEVTVEFAAVAACGVQIGGTQTLTVGGEASSSVRLGVQWDSKNGFQGVGDRSFKFDRIGPEVTSDASLVASCGAGLEVDVSFYDVAGITLTVMPDVRALVRPPNWQIDMGVTGKLGGELGILDHQIGSFDKQLFDFSTTLAKGTL